MTQQRPDGLRPGRRGLEPPAFRSGRCGSLRLAMMRRRRPSIPGGAGGSTNRNFTPVRRRAHRYRGLTQLRSRLKQIDAIGMAVTWWGYVDLNHEPLPDQGSSAQSATCSIAGPVPIYVPVTDREARSGAASSGTWRARPSDLDHLAAGRIDQADTAPRAAGCSPGSAYRPAVTSRAGTRPGCCRTRPAPGGPSSARPWPGCPNHPGSPGRRARR